MSFIHSQLVFVAAYAFILQYINFALIVPGGSLAWNSIYCEVREDAAAVDMWMLEILSHLMLAFDVAQADDPAIGTHEQTKAAILHVKRILLVKKELFWKVSSLYGMIVIFCLTPGKICFI